MTKNPHESETLSCETEARKKGEKATAKFLMKTVCHGGCQRLTYITCTHVLSKRPSLQEPQVSPLDWTAPFHHKKKALYGPNAPSDTKPDEQRRH